MAVALVTDGDERVALAVVRSLGRAGHRVIVAAQGPHSLAGASRYAVARIRAADPLHAPGDFAATIERAVRTYAVDVLIPITDAALLATLPVRQRLFPCQIPFPDLARVRAVGDKARVLEVARALDISIPEQRVLTSPRDAATVASTLRYPVVIKPSRSVVEDGAGGRRKLGVLYAADVGELAAALARLPTVAYPLLLQQRIIGPGVGVFLLLRNREVIATFSHRRIREKPPSGGVSVYRESIPADPGLVARSRALVDQFGWTGVAMVEYKIDARTGTTYLMEINGRLWGSLQLAVDAGVDFPALLVATALGRRAEPVVTYRTGIRSRWLLGDLDQLLTRLRRSRHKLALPQGAAGRLRALLEFLVLWRPGDRTEVLRWRDPAPFVYELRQWVRSAIRPGVRGRIESVRGTSPPHPAKAERRGPDHEPTPAIPELSEWAEER
jgi:predicted ATP-grasp superfamily ATP-dependent carboligase